MFKTRIILTAVILLALVGVLLANMVQRMAHFQQSDAAYLRLFKEVVAFTKQSYVEKVDDKKLMTGAINGMLAALDPHSTYMPVTSYNEMKVHMAGEFGGLGIQLGTKDGKLMVEAPIEDTPAFRAGIQSGDHIWTIDGKPTQGVSINDCVSRMRGTPGTSVTLGILREGTKEPLSFKLVRAIIKTKSVKAKLLEPGYAYLGISEFQERTGEDFERALQTLAADNGGPLKGLILDLRYNPGGLLDQAIRVTNRFVGEGLSNGLIVSTKGRSAGSDRQMLANIGEKEPHYPIVVLINGGSASASEIVAGALQDHKRAVIMGTQSFGKGSVQSLITLPNGDGLKLTTARYYTPSGRSIQAKGITPDITVEFAKKPAQPDKKKMPEIREQDLDGHMQQVGAPKEAPAASEPPAAPLDPKAQEQLSKDNQLARALDLLKGVNLLKAGLK
ncbi:peptidase S41 [Geomonas limicola]|uniref:Peptidase S41 n=1 Tax=Geomonas limicola TaxID=2740186 RepID=A0A6V8NBV1_9BACT|nr:S41 family peptidase [Geomonas limicola]GFO69023.1 peptidase S41 [Geomonas limicola]